MTISTIRRADSDDLAAVRAAAIRFCDRHGIRYNSPDEAEQEIEFAMDAQSPGYDQARIRKLWTACYCRALGLTTDVRTTIAYGHVGLRVE